MGDVSLPTEAKVTEVGAHITALFLCVRYCAVVATALAIGSMSGLGKEEHDPLTRIEPCSPSNLYAMGPSPVGCTSTPQH